MTVRSLMTRILLTAMTLLASCSSDEGVNGGNNNVINEFIAISFTSNEISAIKCTESFSWNMLKAINEQEDGNYIFSPLSASICLTMLANGSEGQTLDEICEALGVSNGQISTLNSYSEKLLDQISTVDNTTDIKIANAMFYASNFTVYNSYIETISNTFGAEVSSVDDDFASQINSWAYNQTDGKIEKFEQNSDLDILYCLLNAMCFDAFWKDKFDPDNTITQAFTSTSSTQNASYMCDKRTVRISQNGDIAIATLYFGNGAFEISFILPDENLGINGAIAMLDTNVIDNLDVESLSVNLRIPKFEVESKIDLIPAMRQCGINKAFNENAELSKISQMSSYISKMKQGCKFDIDEEGVTVAATTSVYGGEIANYIADGGDFFLNRPFLFLIRERSSNSIVFMGKIASVS